MEIIITKKYKLPNGTNLKPGIAHCTDNLANLLIKEGYAKPIYEIENDYISKEELIKELDWSNYKFEKNKLKLKKFGLIYENGKYQIKRKYISKIKEHFKTK